MPSTARTAATTSSSPRRSPTSRRHPIDLDDLVTREIQDGAAAHARRDPRPRAGLLPRPRRLDAPAVVRGRRPRHERHRRRRRSAGGRQRVGAEALRHHRPHDQLLRRRRQPDRLGAGDDEPRGRLEAAGRDSSSRTTSTPSRRTCRRSPPTPGSPSAGQGFGIPSWRVDGMDPLAVHLAMAEAAERLRSGEGPAVIEAEVYRFFHQNGPYPGSAFGYRTKDEEAAWRERDPLAARGQRDADARPGHRRRGRRRARAGAGGHARRGGRAARGRPRERGQAPHPARACGPSPTSSTSGCAVTRASSPTRGRSTR